MKQTTPQPARHADPTTLRPLIPFANGAHVVLGTPRGYRADGLLGRFESTTGITILEGYGLTEGTCVSTANPPLGERRAGSVGIRIPFQQMKAVIHGQHGMTAPPTE